MNSNYSNENYLIIGNLGYVGSSLAPFLKQKKIDSYLTGFDIGYFAGCVFSALDLSDHSLDKQIYGDVRKFDYEILNGVNHVVYLAAISNDPMGNAYMEQTNQINTASAWNIAKEAKARGVKTFTFASSCSIYGAGGEDVKDENSTVQPLTPYAKSKVEAENMLRHLANQDFSITCLRFATACGASARLRLDLVLNDFVASACVNGTIEILSDGTPWRPLIDVQSMCEAIHWAVHRNNTVVPSFLAINVGFNSWNFTVRDLADIVARQIIGSKVQLGNSAPVDNRSYKVDFSMYRKLSGINRQRSDIEGVISGLVKLITNSNENLIFMRESDYIRLVTLRKYVAQGMLDHQLSWV